MGNMDRGIRQLQSLWDHPDFMQRITDGQRHERAPLPEHLRMAVLIRDGFTCGSCGKRWLKGEDRAVHIFFQADHIVPVAAGGSDRTDNLWTLCKDCNEAKSNRFTVDVRAARARLVVAYCHDEQPLADDVEFYASRTVFCGFCRRHCGVARDHAEKYELDRWLTLHPDWVPFKVGRERAHLPPMIPPQWVWPSTAN